MRQVRDELGYGVVHVEEGEKAWVEVHGLRTAKVYYGESAWSDAQREAHDLYEAYRRADTNGQIRKAF